METLYTGVVHGFPQAKGLAGGISTGIGGSLDQDGALSLIVVLGGSLSLVALVFAFITYRIWEQIGAAKVNVVQQLERLMVEDKSPCNEYIGKAAREFEKDFRVRLFSDLRSLAGTTLMNLLAALFMVQLLFIIGVGGVQDAELCISLGLSLQYIRVCVVCWLAAMCHHLYATVASIPSRDEPPAYIKYSIFAWGAPLLSLGGATMLQSQESGDLWNVTDLTPFNCWFLGKKATVYTYGLPVIFLLLLSGFYLLKAAIVARYTCSMQLEIKQREKMKKRRTLQLVLFLKVCLTVGLVAGCGVAARIWEVPFLWAMFCTGHSLQGLAVALSVACNCRVLKVYSRRAHKQPKQQIAKSSSMQLLAPAPDPV